MRHEIDRILEMYALLDDPTRTEQVERWRERVTAVHAAQSERLTRVERVDLGPILNEEWRAGLDRLGSLLPSPNNPTRKKNAPSRTASAVAQMDVAASWADGRITVEWADVPGCEMWFIRVKSSTGPWQTTSQLEASQRDIQIGDVDRSFLPAKVFVTAKRRGAKKRTTTLAVGQAPVVTKRPRPK